MNKMFSPDSPLMSFGSQVANLMLLNVCFLLTCIPVVTIGPALCAMYRVIYNWKLGRDSRVIAPYFEAFFKNMKQGLPAGILYLLVLASLLADINLIVMMELPGRLLFILIGACLLAAAMMFAYVFPLISLFSNSFLGMLKNGILMGFGYLPRSVLAVVLNLLPLAAALLNPLLFVRLGILWLGLYFSLSAYINSCLFYPCFAPLLGIDED